MLWNIAGPLAVGIALLRLTLSDGRASVVDTPWDPCPPSFAYGGLVTVYGADYVVAGTAVRLQPLGRDEDGYDRGKYSFPPGYFYEDRTPPGSKMSASAARVKCIWVIDAFGYGIFTAHYYSFDNLRIVNATAEEETYQCADGAYVDDPSGCVDEGGGNGGGETGGGGGGGGGDSSGGQYYMCYITYWSDGTWEADCYGPYDY